MRYQNIKKAVFLSRPNRFIAECLVDGKKVIVHVKNTGRCKEILIPGAVVYLEEPKGRERKTKFDLVAVEKTGKNGEIMLINIDSQAPNEVVEEFLKSGRLFPCATEIRREFKVGNSRFDFRIKEGENITYLEVKGVTLENKGIALFPDAPTERGVKHIEELIALKEQGYGAAIIFVIQMKGISEFRPNEVTHQAFAEALSRADDAGVKICAYDCKVTTETLCIDEAIPINLL